MVVSDNGIRSVPNAFRKDTAQIDDTASRRERGKREASGIFKRFQFLDEV
jgi:hypothetical protein